MAETVGTPPAGDALSVNWVAPGASVSSTRQGLLRGLDRKSTGSRAIATVRAGKVNEPLKPAPERIDFVSDPQASAKFQEVLAQRQRSVVLQFVTVEYDQFRWPPLLPPPLNAPITLIVGAVLSGCLLTVVAVVLKAGFIHRFRPKNLRIADLHCVFGRAGIVARRRQSETRRPPRCPVRR